MTANRKAELQRKLALAPVPKPPAGLAERLKSEIPKELRFDMRKERERFSKSIAFNVRVAASILLMISSLYLVLNLLSRAGNDRPIASADQKSTPIPVAVATTGSNTATITPQSEIRYREAKPQIVAARTKAPEKQAKKDEHFEAGKVAANIETRTAAVAAAPAAVPPPAAPAEAAAQDALRDPRRLKEAINVTAMAPNVAKQRDADPIVQRFSVPATLPTGSIVLDTEAARGNFEETEIFLRASVDSGIDARDVHVDVLLSPDSVARNRWLAGGWRWGVPLFRDQSHTSLATIAISRIADDTERLATIRLTYRIGEDPAEHSIEKIVRRGDVRTWSAASRRMKSSALAAEWASGRSRTLVAVAARDAGLGDLAAFVESEAP